MKLNLAMAPGVKKRGNLHFLGYPACPPYSADLDIENNIFLGIH